MDLSSVNSFTSGPSRDSRGEHVIHKIRTSKDGAYVHLGKRKFRKQDLVQAFGGTLQAGASAPTRHRFGNPAPLGLSAFALTMFVAALPQARAMGVHNANISIGLAFFYGGLIQMLTGMWAMALENTFAATMLTSYAGFWITQAVPHVPWFGVSYQTTGEKNHALGFMYLGWFLFNTMLTTCTMKSTLALFSFCAVFDVYLLLLTVANMATVGDGVTQAAGVVGIIVAMLGWYNAYAGVANGENAYFTVSPVRLPGARENYPEKIDMSVSSSELTQV